METAKCSKCGQQVALVLARKGKVLANHTRFVTYTSKQKCEGSGENPAKEAAKEVSDDS